MHDPVPLPRLKLAPSLLSLIKQMDALNDAYDFNLRANVETAAPADKPIETMDVIITVGPDSSQPQMSIPAVTRDLATEVKEVVSNIDSNNAGKRAETVQFTEFYISASLNASEIKVLVDDPRVKIIWLNPKTEAHLLTSVDTIKASASWRTFAASGAGITWAVLDTGVQADHLHFQQYSNLDRALSKSFVGGDPLVDANGHGTHVAGIIAGAAPEGKYSAATFLGSDIVTTIAMPLSGPPSGVAPKATLVSVKVLDDNNTGTAFKCIQGLEYLRQMNQGGTDIRIDGANLSLGYPLDVDTYGCGFSPLCEELNRAVNAGICVVVSCGNSGYSRVQTLQAGATSSGTTGSAISITDPANAELCIAVGSVHKEEPHKYGVSYFSSKGPTLDGRKKPDLVAPGEKIISCNVPGKVSMPFEQYAYREMSGTSMAAPHVSGAIAAFLSVRKDYRGDPRSIKRVFKSCAIDLEREVSHQGAGLLDGFKALMSV